MTGQSKKVSLHVSLSASSPPDSRKAMEVEDRAFQRDYGGRKEAGWAGLCTIETCTEEGCEDVQATLLITERPP